MQNKYSTAVAELFEKHPSVQTSGFGNGAYKPGLEAMMRLDDVLGHPWRRYQCLHVAGTNGKGSVSSMLAASLSAEGLCTGLYTSPHLLDFRERMKIVSGGSFECISEEEVLEFLESYADALEPLSFFEITTGMAMWWFARRNADAVVFEVGLGGRLDATNIITPKVSVVTSIGLDHCALLGNTRSEIAGEKAGIFKPGVPAVIWGYDPETSPVFESRASELGCPLTYANTGSVPDDNHLTANLNTAKAALRVMGHEPQEAMLRYKEITGLMARWDVKEVNGKKLIYDIGHNPAALEGCFAKLMKESGGTRPTIIYGVMADKDLDGIAPLMPSDADYILCAPGTSRSLPVEKLHERVQQLRPDLKTIAAESVSAAVQIALSSDSQLIYIGGSTFVASEAYIK